MNLLQMSERIRDHLTKQKAQSLSVRHCCAYRGENGNMCAVGCLITDEAYKPNIEAVGVNAVSVNDALRKSGIALEPGALTLLSDWQRYHDSMASRGRGYSYHHWIKGDETHSPTEFHDFIVEQHNLKGATQQ